MTLRCRHSWGDGGGALARHEGPHVCMEEYGHTGSHACGRYDHGTGGQCGESG